MKTFETILAELKTDPAYYHSDRETQVFKAFRTHPDFMESTVAVGGLRLNVYHVGNKLIGIYPRAASAGRGHFVLSIKDGDSWCLPILGIDYSFDPCPRSKVATALSLALTAWTVAEGDIDAFYKALGATGYCAICGAFLTDPVSMSRGIGPECIKKIWGGRAAQREVMQARMLA